MSKHFPARLGQGLAVLILTAGAVLVGGAAVGAPAGTDTSVEHDHFESFVDALACGEGAPLYTFNVAGTTVQHVTDFADGRFTVSFTADVGFVAVPLDPGLPTYQGRFTLTFELQRGQGDESAPHSETATWNIMAIADDGSRISRHQVSHHNVQPDGSLHEFFRCQ
jgi:hypothetical protein